jgi:hypothetical protein
VALRICVHRRGTARHGFLFFASGAQAAQRGPHRRLSSCGLFCRRRRSVRTATARDAAASFFLFSQLFSFPSSGCLLVLVLALPFRPLRLRPRARAPCATRILFRLLSVLRAISPVLFCNARTATPVTARENTSTSPRTCVNSALSQASPLGNGTE